MVDGAQMHLVGAVEDLQGSAPGSRVRMQCIRGLAHYAENLDRLIDDLGLQRLHQGGDHGDSLAGGTVTVAIDQPGGLGHQKTGLRNLDPGLG